MAMNLRGVVVGVSTLIGKELIEELNTSDKSWDLRLADTTEASGQLVAGGDEALVVQPLTPDIFAGQDVAFFTAEPQNTLTHWREAKTAGAAIVDMTAALEFEPGATVYSPWIHAGATRSIDSAVVIPAHPAAVMLGIVASQLAATFGHFRLAATVLEPASQQGSKGLDEMHQQTVSLLGFHPLPQEVYDAQVAFNTRISFGEAAKVDLSTVAATIRRHLKAIVGDSVASSVTLQLVQAPVFHGYTMSVYVQLPADVDATAVRRALSGDGIHMASTNEEAPSNQSVVEQPDIAIALADDSLGSHEMRGFWLWLAADNLKLAARNAIACGEELAALRGAKPR